MVSFGPFYLFHDQRRFMSPDHMDRMLAGVDVDRRRGAELTGITFST